MGDQERYGDMGEEEMCPLGFWWTGDFGFKQSTFLNSPCRGAAGLPISGRFHMHCHPGVLGIQRGHFVGLFIVCSLPQTP